MSLEVPRSMNLHVETVTNLPEGIGVSREARGVLTSVNLEQDGLAVMAHEAFVPLHEHVYSAYGASERMIPLQPDAKRPFFAPVPDGDHVLEVAACYTFGAGQLPHIAVYMRNAPPRYEYERLVDAFVVLLGTHALQNAQGGPQSVAAAAEYTDREQVFRTYTANDLTQMRRRLERRR